MMEELSPYDDDGPHIVKTEGGPNGVRRTSIMEGSLPLKKSSKYGAAASADHERRNFSSTNRPPSNDDRRAYRPNIRGGGRFFMQYGGYRGRGRGPSSYRPRDRSNSPDRRPSVGENREGRIFDSRGDVRKQFHRGRDRSSERRTSNHLPDYGRLVDDDDDDRTHPSRFGREDSSSSYHPIAKREEKESRSAATAESFSSIPPSSRQFKDGRNNGGADSSTSLSTLDIERIKKMKAQRLIRKGSQGGEEIDERSEQQNMTDAGNDGTGGHHYRPYDRRQSADYRSDDSDREGAEGERMRSRRTKDDNVGEINVYRGKQSHSSKGGGRPSLLNALGRSGLSSRSSSTPTVFQPEQSSDHHLLEVQQVLADTVTASLSQAPLVVLKGQFEKLRVRRLDDGGGTRPAPWSFPAGDRIISSPSSSHVAALSTSMFTFNKLDKRADTGLEASAAAAASHSDGSTVQGVDSRYRGSEELPSLPVVQLSRSTSLKSPGSAPSMAGADDGGLPSFASVRPLAVDRSVSDSGITQGGNSIWGNRARLGWGQGLAKRGSSQTQEPSPRPSSSATIATGSSSNRPSEPTAATATAAATTPPIIDHPSPSDPVVGPAVREPSVEVPGRQKMMRQVSNDEVSVELRGRGAESELRATSVVGEKKKRKKDELSTNILPLPKGMETNESLPIVKSPIKDSAFTSLSGVVKKQQRARTTRGRTVLRRLKALASSYTKRRWREAAMRRRLIDASGLTTLQKEKTTAAVLSQYQIQHSTNTVSAAITKTRKERANDENDEDSVRTLKRQRSLLETFTGADDGKKGAAAELPHSSSRMSLSSSSMATSGGGKPTTWETSGSSQRERKELANRLGYPVCGLLPSGSIDRGVRVTANVWQKRKAIMSLVGEIDDAKDEEQQKDPKMVRLPSRDDIQCVLEDLDGEVERLQEEVSQVEQEVGSSFADQDVPYRAPWWSKTYTIVGKIRREAGEKALLSHAAQNPFANEPKNSQDNGISVAAAAAAAAFQGQNEKTHLVVSSTSLASSCMPPPPSSSIPTTCVDAENKKVLIQKIIKNKKEELKLHRNQLVNDYVRIRESWRRNHAAFNGDDQEAGISDVMRTRNWVGARGLGSRSLTADRSLRAYAGSEYDVALLARELEEKEKMRQRIESGSAQVPAMILDVERRGAFEFMDVSNARLTTDGNLMRCAEIELHALCRGSCNCPRAVEAERRITNPWSDMEKCIFLDKLLQYPKNFRKIATFLRRKNTNDVVEFYYDSKQYINYKALLKESEGRRRGTESDVAWLKQAAQQVGATIDGNDRGIIRIYPPANDNLYSTHDCHPGGRAFHHDMATRSSNEQSAGDGVAAMFVPSSRWNHDQHQQQQQAPFGLSSLSTMSIKPRTNASVAGHEALHQTYDGGGMGVGKDEKGGAEDGGGGYDMMREAAHVPLPPPPRGVGEGFSPRQSPHLMHSAEPKRMDNGGKANRKGGGSGTTSLLAPDHEHSAIPSSMSMAATAPTEGDLVWQSMSGGGGEMIPLTTSTMGFAAGGGESDVYSSISSMPAGAAAAAAARKSLAKWTEEEKEQAIELMGIHGKAWGIIAKEMGNSKRPEQIRNFFQNYKKKLRLDEKLPGGHGAYRSRTNQQRMMVAEQTVAGGNGGTMPAGSMASLVSVIRQQHHHHQLLLPPRIGRGGDHQQPALLGMPSMKQHYQQQAHNHPQEAEKESPLRAIQRMMRQAGVTIPPPPSIMPTLAMPLPHNAPTLLHHQQQQHQPLLHHQHRAFLSTEEGEGTDALRASSVAQVDSSSESQELDGAEMGQEEGRKEDRMELVGEEGGSIRQVEEI